MCSYYINICIMVFNLFLLFTNIFCLLNLQKIAKRKPYRFDLLFLYILWYEWNNFHVYVFYHACGKFHVLSISVMKLKWSMARDYYFTISRKRGSWKFWLDPRFLRNSKPKWTLKWLPLNKGYFKFYFHKGAKVY